VVEYIIERRNRLEYLQSLPKLSRKMVAEHCGLTRASCVVTGGSDPIPGYSLEF